MTQGHIHAKLMMQYAEDAAQYKFPWLHWEYNTGLTNDWYNLTSHPTWRYEITYRRKPIPSKIEINGEKFPAATTQPAHRNKYWTVDHCIDKSFYAEHYVWQGDHVDCALFESGNVFNTQEQAKAVADKLNQVFKNRVV